MQRRKFPQPPVGKKNRFVAMVAIGLVTCGAAFANPDKIHGYIALDTLPYTRVSNALAANVTAPASYGFRGAITVAHDRVLIEGAERDYSFDHHSNYPGGACNSGLSCDTIVGSDPNYRSGACPGGGDPGCVTVIGHNAYQSGSPQSGMVYIPAQTEADHDDELHVAIKTHVPSLYAGVGEFTRSFSYAGYPKITGAGVGLTLAPDLGKKFSPYGSLWYYPHVTGKYTGATSTSLGVLSGATFKLGYRVTTYEVGATYAVPNSALFIGLHVGGDRSKAVNDAPVNTTHNSIGLTFGLHR